MKVVITKQIVELGRKELLSYISNLEDLVVKNQTEEALIELALLRKEINKKTDLEGIE